MGLVGGTGYALHERCMPFRGDLVLITDDGDERLVEGVEHLPGGEVVGQHRVVGTGGKELGEGPASDGQRRIGGDGPVADVYDGCDLVAPLKGPRRVAVEKDDHRGVGIAGVDQVDAEILAVTGRDVVT